MIIRKARQEDEKAITDICYETKTYDINDTDDRDLFALRWALYYVRYQTDYCFVAEDNDEIIGYILCTPDTIKCENDYEKKIIPIIKEMIDKTHPQYRYYTTILKTIDIIPQFLNHYPAHLHINMTPKCQGKGIGTKLIKAMEQNLIDNGIHGIHLGVMEDNPAAIRFYERNGYKRFHRHFLGEGVGWDIFMGKTLISPS